MSAEFGDYEILSEIGRGGMGIVYQAKDKDGSRLVAIKQLVLDNVDPKKRREFHDRFRREAAMVARLDHPNIVRVFDVDKRPESDYYVMEYLEGRSLRTELEERGGRMPVEEFLPILKQVAAGLSYAHSLNVVHRDVKPDNIFLLKDGTVKITDFGIARTVDLEQTHLTKTGVMLGTLAYVSPEQLQDAKNVDHRADLFSLAIVTYEALSGKLPFTGDGIAKTVIKILSAEAEPLHLLQPDVKVETAAVVSRAIRKKARDRYMSVSDFYKAFEQSVLEDVSETKVESDSIQALIVKAKQEESKVAATPGIPLEIGKAGTGPAPAMKVTRAAGRHDALDISESYLVRHLAIIGGKGEDRGLFLEPSCVAARLGKVVVADKQRRNMQLFSVDGRWLKDIVAGKFSGESVTGGGSLTNPSGLAIDGRGRLYVADNADHFIRVFDSQGKFLKEFKNIHGKEGGIQGLTLDSSGIAYVSDPDNGCLQAYLAETGAWMRKLGSKGTGKGQLKLPSQLACDRLNQIYVVDYGTSRVSVFAKTGIFIRSFGGKGTANGLFNVPRGIAVDRNDRIFVADSLNHRVQIFGPAGEWLYSFGGKGTEPGKFIGPSGLSIDSQSNRLYVCDRGNQRVQVFELMKD